MNGLKKSRNTIPNTGKDGSSAGTTRVVVVVVVENVVSRNVGTYVVVVVVVDRRIVVVVVHVVRVMVARRVETTGDPKGRLVRHGEVARDQPEIVVVVRIAADATMILIYRLNLKSVATGKTLQSHQLVIVVSVRAGFDRHASRFEVRKTTVVVDVSFQLVAVKGRSAPSLQTVGAVARDQDDGTAVATRVFARGAPRLVVSLKDIADGAVVTVGRILLRASIPLFVPYLPIVARGPVHFQLVVSCLVHQFAS